MEPKEYPYPDPPYPYPVYPENEEYDKPSRPYGPH
jgi:hypothetical protein